MAEGTRMRSMDKKLDPYDELLLELRNGQQNLTATQHGIQGTLYLLLEHINVMERANHSAALVGIADQLGDSPFGVIHRRLSPTFRIVVLWVIG
uniref:Uncharacterized protein n=1 Tax=Solanum tuberosum TaxID=4113 RepID=M1DB69_SOLTU